MDFSGYRFKSDIFKRQLAEEIDKAVAKEAAVATARAIVMVLEARAIRLDETTRTTIFSCMDLPTLEQWLQCAATASDADDVVRH